MLEANPKISCLALIKVVLNKTHFRINESDSDRIKDEHLLGLKDNIIGIDELLTTEGYLDLIYDRIRLENMMETLMVYQL